MIIGLDCGRSSVKVVGANQFFSFPSLLGEWRERRLANSHGNDLEVEYKGVRYFAGDLAKYESEFARSMMTETKAHDDTLLLMLIAIAKTGLNRVKVVTGVPVNQHKESEKGAIRKMLMGKHSLNLNGRYHEVSVERVEVAVEGGAAFWVKPSSGKVRILDAGAKTVNYVTIWDKRYIDMDSGTLSFGLETNKSNDLRQIVNRIVGEVAKKWEQGDKVLLTGGKAKEMHYHFSEYFPNSEVMDNSLYANAKGYYALGVSLL